MLLFVDLASESLAQTHHTTTTTHPDLFRRVIGHPSGHQRPWPKPDHQWPSIRPSDWTTGGRRAPRVRPRTSAAINDTRRLHCSYHSAASDDAAASSDADSNCNSTSAARSAASATTSSTSSPLLPGLGALATNPRHVQRRCCCCFAASDVINDCLDLRFFLSHVCNPCVRLALVNYFGDISQKGRTIFVDSDRWWLFWVRWASFSPQPLPG